MSQLASSNVTWGISDPDFLAGYGLLALAILLGILVARWRLAAGPAGTATGQFSGQPHDIAYLNGGPELAVLSALSSMRVAGTVVAEGRGRLRAAAPLGTDADPLERAIQLAAVVPLSRRDLLTNQIVRTALEKPRQRLEDAGLLLSARQQRRIKRTGVWMLAVAGFGLVRLLAGAMNGAAVGYLILELLAVGIVATILLGRAPNRSRRGVAELKRLRVQHTELAPGMRPDWTTYGPALAGLGVGIFGARALWVSDPAFAADVDAQRVTASTGGFSYHGGGSGTLGGSCGSSGYSRGGCGGRGGGGCGGGCGGGG
jgi:uncharacterized protein (TIGR04222 family)